MVSVLGYRDHLKKKNLAIFDVQNIRHLNIELDTQKPTK